MAVLNNGNLTGKLGNMVGFVREGKNLLRVKSRRTAPPTEKELLNRYIFRLVQDWVTPLNPFVKLGFRNYSIKVSGANAAKSLIYREALHKDGYNSSIDASLVKLSSGTVSLPETLQAQITGEAEVEFSWDPSVDLNGSPRDRIMMLAYHTERRLAEYELSGAKRNQGSDRLPLTHALPGTYHLYAAFISENGEEQSESRYLGSVEI